MKEKHINHMSIISADIENEDGDGCSVVSFVLFRHGGYKCIR